LHQRFWRSARVEKHPWLPSRNVRIRGEFWRMTEAHWKIHFRLGRSEERRREQKGGRSHNQER